MSSVLEPGADPNNNHHHHQGDKAYSLRPRTAIKREEDDEEEVTVWSKRRSKRKPKPQPLSKYRRKTANARERSRMREINEAFDCLRRAVPGGEPEKLTKITTLRLAMKYIAALSQALSEPCPDSDLESLLSDSTTQMSSEPQMSPPLALLEAHIPDHYSDFADHSLPLDPYTDFSSFCLDDPFPPDFS